MSMDPHWERWTHASLSYYWTEYAKKLSVPLYIEAQDRQTTGKEFWWELRWDGIYANEASAGVWFLDISMNMIVSSTTTTKDTHKHKKVVGLAQAGYINDIEVFRFGDLQYIDTQDLLGCYQLRTDRNEAILTTYFGKVDVEVTLEQSTIEAHYRMTLTN